MSATDELRKLLDERGVDYGVKDLPNIKFFHDTRWNANGVHWCYTEFVGARTCLTMCNEWKDCMPEQAVAATIGRGECEDARRPHVNEFVCSACGRQEWRDEPSHEPIRFCPNCGAKVRRCL